jgi:site-specific recombinase XerD
MQPPGSVVTNRASVDMVIDVITAKAVSLHLSPTCDTFASWLVQRGRTLKEVQEALGHQTITMTMRYSHLAPDHLRAAVAVLDGVLSSPESEPTKVSAQEPVAVSEASAN